VVAQTTKIQTFVSSSGNDANTSSGCQMGAPCQTIDRALSVTVAGGAVVCLDTGSFNVSPINITQAVTIDCHDRLVAAIPSTEPCAEDGIVINAPGGVVTLRDINISGSPTSLSDQPICGQNGIHIEAAAVVNLEDCVTENWSQSGISVTTSANMVLNVRNTTIRNVANGISFAPTGAP
jgi:hypothetical protein